MDRLPNIHPGEILEKDFLEPMGISPYRLAKDIGVQQTRISQILAGQRSITVDTAMRLSRYFGTSVKLWLGLQEAYDLEELELRGTAEYDRIRPFNESHHTAKL